MVTYRCGHGTRRTARGLPGSSRLSRSPSWQPLRRNCYVTAFERGGRGFYESMDEPPDKKLAKAKTWNTPKKLLVADGTADAEGANAPPPPTRAAGDAAALNTTDSSAGVSVSDATDAAAAGAEKPLPKGVFRRQVKAGMR